MAILDQLKKSRGKVPTWAQLRSIGNSRAVQGSSLFPAVGYLILLSDQVTSFFDGGLVRSQTSGVWEQLWSAKLYFVYFGLLSLGIGSGLYQWRCPRQIKKHGDWEDYCRVDGAVMSVGILFNLHKALRDSYGLRGISIGDVGDIDAVRANILNPYYAVLSSSEWWSRLIVAIFFYGGLVILFVPSLMTAIRVVVG